MNDNLVEFLMFTVLELGSKKTLQYLQLFSTQFYTKLVSTPSKWTPSLFKLTNAKRSYANVHRWTKTINIFNKTVHIYPINEVKRHWYLIVAVFPAAKNKFAPYMAVLDSNGNGMHDKQLAVEQIKNYLVEEIEAKSIESINTGSVKAMETIYPNLPQQPNGSSCGIYMVYYVKQILIQLEKNVELHQLFVDTSSWFNDHILHHLRYDASVMIRDAAEKFSEQEGLDMLILPDLQVFPTAAEDKAIKRFIAKKRKVQTPDEEKKRNVIDKEGAHEKTTKKMDLVNTTADADENKPSTSDDKSRKDDFADNNLYSRKKRKLTFQEYTQNIEDNQQDYTLLWSYEIKDKD